MIFAKLSADIFNSILRCLIRLPILTFSPPENTIAREVAQMQQIRISEEKSSCLKIPYGVTIQNVRDAVTFVRMKGEYYGAPEIHNRNYRIVREVQGHGFA